MRARHMRRKPAATMAQIEARIADLQIQCDRLKQPSADVAEMLSRQVRAELIVNEIAELNAERATRFGDGQPPPSTGPG